MILVGKRNFARAIAVALALGVAGGAIVAEPAMAQRRQSAPKISYSPAFQKAAAGFDKELQDALKNPTINAASERARAAKDPQAKAAAAAEVDAALGGGRAKLQAVTAAASTPGDKLKTGEMTRIVGVLTDDLALQKQGLVGMIDSGVAAPESLGQLQWLAGVLSYQQGDYAGAITYIRPAYDAGYRDQQGLISQVLADAYKRTNNNAAASEMAQKELSGTGKPSEGAIRTALQAAYDAKQAGQATDLAVKLVQEYPTASSWGSSITVVRALGQLQPQENLDLMRLMARTGSMNDRNDYIEYIQNANPRALPGESLKVIDAGVAAGKLTASETYVREARATANEVLPGDRASLPKQERDARAAGATGATVSGAADALLSYDQPAKAEELYTVALGKPGVDQNRILTRLGIAQADQGKYAEAQANFAKVQGTRASLAKLWSAYAASKGAAPTATTTAPAAQ